MKKIIGLILCLSVGLFGFASYSFAFPGSYKASCNSCQLFGGKLRCWCKRRDGSRRYSKLKHARSCSFIKNLNGHLTCTGDWQWRNLPAGSYEQTCRGCNFNGYRLSCQCQARDGIQRLHSTLMNVHTCRPGTIRNRNGDLRCRRRSSRSLPFGSYQQSCTNCYSDGNNLACLCRRRNNKWRFTLLSGVSQCWRVRNRNGRLHCIYR